MIFVNSHLLVCFPVLLVPFAVLYEVIETLSECHCTQGFFFTVATEGVEVHAVDGWGGGRVVCGVLDSVVVGVRGRTHVTLFVR